VSTWTLAVTEGVLFAVSSTPIKVTPNSGGVGLGPEFFGLQGGKSRPPPLLIE
jgi:hypothetical protein